MPSTQKRKAREMNKTGTLQVLQFLSQTDNRKVTPDVIEAWHAVIGWLDFDTAREAAVACVGDASIKWVEPKHIVAAAKQLISRRKEEQARNEPKPHYIGTPMPVCKAHGKGIIQCDLCCRKARHLNESLGGNSSPEYVARFYQEIAISQAPA